MRLSLLAAVTTFGTAAIAAVAQAPPAAAVVLAPTQLIPTPPQVALVVGGLNDLTELSKNLFSFAKNLSWKNAPLFLGKTGPWAKIVEGLNTITNTAATDHALLLPLKGLAKFKGTEAKLIGDAYDRFTKTHGNLLNKVRGKDRQYNKIKPFVGGPLVTALTANEEAIDNLTYLLIEVADALGVAAGIIEDNKALDRIFDKAIDAFN